MLSNNTKAFFELVRAGLWEKEAQLSQYGSIDFNEILRLSEEQSVVGIVAAGLEHVTDLKVPKEIALQFVGQALQIEQRNTEMNNFIAMLTKRMQEDGIYALLIKGQGVAQCYERPYWRYSGDIDFLLDEDNYKKAKQLLLPMASSTELEAVTIMHFGMTIEKWSVELHGTLHSGLLPKMDLAVDQIQNEAILKRRNRPWSNNGIDVLLPNVDDDIIFVYTHIIKHFFHEGIGLRQICDFVRLLWKYIDEVNVGLLDIRIRSMGLETEWKTFGVIACNYLGFPIERFPFYSQSSIWKRKANKSLSFIIRVGNFGQNRDKSYYNRFPFIFVKCKSFVRRISDYLTVFAIFPLDASMAFLRTLISGTKAIVFK